MRWPHGVTVTPARVGQGTWSAPGLIAAPWTDGSTLVKGVTMKRIGLMACAVLGLALYSSQADASWSALTYSGYQPCWNIFAKRYKCLTCEEERLQKFWHDYYDALKNYYCALDHIDWVAYYKNHGYQINGCCGGPGGGGGCCGRINYAPVFVV